MHRSKVVLAVALLALPLLAGCNKLQARAAFKEGNALYQQEQYRQALRQFQKGLELDPDATFAWRSVGLTALALFRPGDESPENQRYAELAIEAFENYLEDYPDNAKVREYLLTIYVQGKRFDDALAYLDRNGDPTDPAVARAKVNILTQAQRYEEAWRVAQRAAATEQPQMLYTIGVATWDQAYRNPALNFEQRNKVVDVGLAALKRALAIKPDYFEAMAYYNLLFREKAKLETDGARRLEYLAQADHWMKKAIELRNKQQEAEKKAAKKAAEEAAAAEEGGGSGAMQ
jgi:tetratricopeptide (TPR) repeat protein